MQDGGSTPPGSTKMVLDLVGIQTRIHIISMRELTDFEVAWMAGLLEGEGSFMKSPPSSPNTPRVVIQMCDLDVIQRVAEMWGTSVSKTGHHKKNENWRPSWKVTLRSGPAIDLMTMVYPHMGARRKEQIEEAVAEYNPGTRRSSLSESDIEDIKASQEGTRPLAEYYKVSRHTIQALRK